MRKILHSDLNNFYASVECLLNPSLREFPVVVCGRVEDRHGIVLAKNMIAKNAGVKTGMVLYEARNLCPNLKCVEAHHDLYLKYSRAVKAIYQEYTDRVESFGIDEAWLDITDCKKHGGDAFLIANEIRERIKAEIGLTVSIGVSFNKVFAKLGSDLKKPDAITVISDENYKEIVWPLPVGDLLYVGRATKHKLNDLAIKTIGDLARFDQKLLISKFGKVGAMLSRYARGEDSDTVKTKSELAAIKSIGNSLTYYRDIKTDQDAFALITLLAESVSTRMSMYGYKMARTVHIVVITNELKYINRMKKMQPTCLAEDIALAAFKLFKANFSWGRSLVRGLGVSVSDFCEEEQLSIDSYGDKVEKKKALQNTIENLRSRYGRNIINKAVIFADKRMQNLDILGTHYGNIGKQVKKGIAEE
ncbi:MAG: DNA polymerase IV [Clostridia bacterium]|nr:DNA polymerase IV [Clostridia bacterium]